MRDVKFRAWDHRRKFMFIIYDNATKNTWFIPTVNKFYTVMQYTGLKDIAGKNIYEGDIVEIGGVKYQVHFDEETFSYVLIVINASNKTRWMYLYEAKNNIKVIGNIFENEDLIGA